MPEISRFYGIIIYLYWRDQGENQWLDLHEDEILSMFEKARNGEHIGKVDPLF